ncbi:hypothetical protein BDW22DRAFT_807222 [Trametopsis cervina]|nr:hypothetical protein BDW22DRAFT_807222 [Trametopsis cervina]
MNFVDIDSPGRTTDLEQGHEWLSEQGREPGEWPEPNVRPPLLVKVTLCRVLYTTVVCGFGTWKAVAAYEGNAILSNTLDVFIGIILAVLLYWLGLFETVNPPVLTWFFHEDYAVILNSLFTSRASSHQSVEMRALHVPAPTAFAFIQDSDDVSESQMTEQDISASELVRLLPMGSSITTQLEIRMEEVRRTPGSPDNPTSSSNRPSESTLTHRTQGKAPCVLHRRPPDLNSLT